MVNAHSIIVEAGRRYHHRYDRSTGDDRSRPIRFMTQETESAFEYQSENDEGLLPGKLRTLIKERGMRQALPHPFGIETIWGSVVDALLDREDIKLFTISS